MTKADIIKAAFKVWGQDFYSTTSLSQVSQELGVTKTALYRHFKDKDALLKEMYVSYFDDFTAFIMESYKKAISTADPSESCLIIMRTFAKYYILNRNNFIFSLIQVYNRKESGNIREEFLVRGIDLSLLSQGKEENGFFPSKFHLVMVTLLFWIGQFHQQKPGKKSNLNSQELDKIISDIESHIKNGVGLNMEVVNLIDFQKLEEQSLKQLSIKSWDNPLLEAVSEAVAEAGPWNVSMEMVARQSGLSKSGLYAHFNNKQDMLEKLFMTEFSVIISSAKEQIETSIIPEEQLYLGIMSIVNHLRSHPGFLMSLEWLKTRKVFLEKFTDRLQEFIEKIQMEHIKQQDQQYLFFIAQWILFMIVSTLAWWPYIFNRKLPESNSNTWGKILKEIPNESFRTLFRFIALGTEGLKL